MSTNLSRRPVGRTLAAAVVLVAAAACPAAVLRAQEPVSFATPDDGLVSADVYGSGLRAVVLAPGGRFDKASWASQARMLADAGFRVLALDFRGRGASRAGRAGADSLQLDVLGAVRWLRATGASTVSLVGASIGGWAAAEAVLAADPGEIDRAVLLAHASIEHPERLGGRTLFLVSSGDTTAAGVPRLAAIRRQYERASGVKELVVVDGTAHAQFLFRTAEGDRVLREIVRFLSAP